MSARSRSRGARGLFLLAEDGLYQLGPSRDDFMGFSIHPHDPRVVYTSGHPRAGGNLGVMRSDDGGRTWRQVFRGVAGETVAGVGWGLVL